MKYNLLEYSIKDLIALIENDKVDLNPSYQRNFIWTLKDQQELIDTLVLGYPLPNFFIYDRGNGTYEMVDGQQRSKTIYRFVKGLITSSAKTGKVKFINIDSEEILNYKLPFIFMNSLEGTQSLNEFYVLINKKGIHLNIPEVNKSEHHDKLFLKLAYEVLSYQNFINLNLFTEATSKRMNDRAFVEELLGYLRHGIKEKKKSVEDSFKDDITEEEYQILYKEFCQIIDVIEDFNKIHALADTRYKQKNDFYTLFNFIDENIDFDREFLKYFYQILLVLDGTDKEGLQFIRPSNSECTAFKEYANNCVTQSNSKTARDERLKFFNAILKNPSEEPNSILANVLDYFIEVFGDDKVGLIEKNDFWLLDIDKITEV